MGSDSPLLDYYDRDLITDQMLFLFIQFGYSKNINFGK